MTGKSIQDTRYSFAGEGVHRPGVVSCPDHGKVWSRHETKVWVQDYTGGIGISISIIKIEILCTVIKCSRAPDTGVNTLNLHSFDYTYTDSAVNY